MTEIFTVVALQMFKPDILNALKSTGGKAECYGPTMDGQ